MRLVSFEFDGRTGYGVLTAAGVAPAPGPFLERFADLRAVIAADALPQLQEAAAGAGIAPLPLETIAFLPPVANPDKIVCVGKNYSAHAAESGNRPADNPGLFLRLANTLVPHGGALVRPVVSEQFDYEGELALVIGRRGRHIAADEALAHVAGYSCFHDGSVRDYQFEHSMTAGKNFMSTAGFGPWLVTADEIPEPSALTISTRVNGRERQNGRTADMIFAVEAIIAYVSRFTELVPGDVIATGTPEGVGFARKPPLWLKPGDVVEVEVSRIGTLCNRVEAERA